MKRLAFFLCLVALTLPGCSQLEQEDQAGLSAGQKSGATDDLAGAPDEMLSSFSVSGYGKDGMRQWDLEGTSADIMSEEIKLNDVRGKVYGQQANMTIVAEEGSLNRSDNNVHLEKNVVVTSDDGARLTADYLDWDAQNQTLASESAVWLQRGIMQAMGTGLSAQPELYQVALKKDVTVEVSPAKQDAAVVDAEVQATVITCDGSLDVDYQKNLAVFHDSVKVRDRRGKIFADKMDVYFAAQQDKGKQLDGMEGMGLERVVAWGDVEIHRGPNITYSQKAVYDTASGRLTLTGQPKLIIYSTEDLAKMGTAPAGQFLPEAKAAE